jgi:hypothetical protein
MKNTNRQSLQNHDGEGGLKGQRPFFSGFLNTKRYLLLPFVLTIFHYLQAASPLIKAKGKLYFSALSSEKALVIIAKRHKWQKTGEEYLSTDTVGTFDINGMPAYVVRYYSYDNLQFEAFYFIYLKKDRVYFSPLGFSRPGKLFSFSNFSLVTLENIYLFLYFKEEKLENSEKATGVSKEFLDEAGQGLGGEHQSRMDVFIAAFSRKHQCRFLAYKIPVSIINDPIPGAEYRLKMEIESDKTLRVIPLTDSVHARQKRLLGAHRIPKFRN